MKKKPLLSIFLILQLAILTVPCFGQNSKLKITSKDKSAIVELVLDSFFEDYPDEIDSNEIILSSQNINLLLIPKHSRIKLILLSPEEITAKANVDRVIDYLAFSEFTIKDSKILITLENLSVRSIDSKVEPFFGHGFFWEAKKKSGKWLVECVSTSAFTSISGETDSL